MTVPTKATNTATPLEDQIFQRLAAWQAAHQPELDALEEYRKLPAEVQKLKPSPPQPERDRTLEGLIYTFLYGELRGVATVLPGLNWQAINPKADVSCRFSSVLNRAFLRILEKYPDRLLRARSRKQLTGFVSLIMSQLMLNHYKRKGTFQKVLHALGLTAEEESQVADIISQLADEKGSYFEERTGVNFMQGLQVIESWQQSTDPGERQQAQVLRLRYVDGLSYDEIATEMRLTKADVENTLERAKYHLRKLDK